MNTNKKHLFINKLAENTANNKYEWYSLNENRPNRLNDAISPADLSQLNLINCYWFENEKQMIFLLATFQMQYSLLLIDKGSNKTARMKITTESYFRLKTLILNSLGTQDKLINDFLDS
ncbi:hypothetical protein ACQKKE_05370 [Desemzia incerta]|uniref:hypothetical protein n=1 Tax=Desemzia incerta TaxID=82801 RepID=UPI003D01DCC6